MGIRNLGVCGFLCPIVIYAQSFTISTIAGTDNLRDGGQATSSVLQRPIGLAVDSAGNLYIADSTANRVRKVTPAGVISTVAGTGHAAYHGDGAAAIKADLYSPYSVAVDKANNLYIADRNNNVVRRVQLSTGIITTVAGSSKSDGSGDGGPATQAGIDPYSIALDKDGNLYIADYYNNRVRKVVMSTGVITTVAGTGNMGYSGDNGPAVGATLYGPTGIVVDPAGNIFISELFNNTIRKVSAADGKITTIAGTGATVTGGRRPRRPSPFPVPSPSTPEQRSFTLRPSPDRSGVSTSAPGLSMRSPVRSIPASKGMVPWRLAPSSLTPRPWQSLRTATCWWQTPATIASAESRRE